MWLGTFFIVSNWEMLINLLGRTCSVNNANAVVL